MINQDLIVGAAVGFAILLIVFILYVTVFRKVMPDQKEDDGKPFFPYND